METVAMPHMTKATVFAFAVVFNFSFGAHALAEVTKTGVKAELFDIAVLLPSDRWHVPWLTRYPTDGSLGLQVITPDDHKKPRVHDGKRTFLQVEFRDQRNESNFFIVAEPPRDGYASPDALLKEYEIEDTKKWYAGKHYHRELSRSESVERLATGETVDVIKITMSINDQRRDIWFASFTHANTWFMIVAFNKGKQASHTTAFKTLLEGITFLRSN